MSAFVLKTAGNIMSRVFAALLAASLLAVAIPTAASAGCYSCYAPPQPCGTCYQQPQQVVVPPQYRTLQQTVMVAPGRTVAHRTPARYRTVMVPKTVMVAPEGVSYERIPARYATERRTVMVAPARSYYVQPAPVYSYARPHCGSCGY